MRQLLVKILQLFKSSAKQDNTRHKAEHIDITAIDQDALKVIHRLKKFGHEAYLVGGCVRDLWLGLKPIDFDITTSAKPQEIKELFRNSRIIGRRFKLVHILFGRKIIDTATFRRDPEKTESADLLITSDNVFGSAKEDALRRDFTINGLLLDPETREVLDYVGGIQDLEKRQLCTIGDPQVRFREDPVRIIRAVKFTARMDFHMDEAMRKAMLEVAPDLQRSAAARILVELLKLMRSGYATVALQQLNQINALQYVLAELAQVLHDWQQDSEQAASVEKFWKHIEQIDKKILQGQNVTTALAIASLFYPAFEMHFHRSGNNPREISRIARDVILPFTRKVRLPRAISGRVQRICIAQRRFLMRPGKRFGLQRFVQQDYFAEALEFFGMQCQAAEKDLHIYKQWLERHKNLRNNERRPRRPQPPRRKLQRPRDDDDSDPFARKEEKDPTWGDW